MKHSGIILGVALSMIAVQGFGAHLAKPTKPRLSVSANLNPQSWLAKPKAADGTDAEDSPVLEKGSRVVASNTPDEDFVILGSLEPVLHEPPHIETDAEVQTQTNEMVAKTLADSTPRMSTPIGPPPLLKAPVEVKAGIQPEVPSQAVVVAGPNIGASPAVNPDKVQPTNAAVAVEPSSPITEASALKPPPAIDLLLQRPEKAPVVAEAEVQKPVIEVKQPVSVAAIKPVKTPEKVIVKVAMKPAHQTIVKKPAIILAKTATKPPVKHPMVVAVKTAIKTPMKKPVVTVAKAVVKVPVVAMKTPVKKPAKPSIAMKVNHVIAKINPPKAKPTHLALAAHHPVLVKTKLVFASYQPPKHKTVGAPKAVLAKPMKVAFKPVIKPFKRSSTLHVERKPHFHPVIKPYLRS